MTRNLQVLTSTIGKYDSGVPYLIGDDPIGEFKGHEGEIAVHMYNEWKFYRISTNQCIDIAGRQYTKINEVYKTIKDIKNDINRIVG